MNSNTAACGQHRRSYSLPLRQAPAPAHPTKLSAVPAPVQEKAVAAGAGAAVAPNGTPPPPALANGHHAPDADKAAAVAAPGEGVGGETKRSQDGDSGAVVPSKGGGPAVTAEDGVGGLAQCLVELSGTVPDFPGLEEKAGALLVRGKIAAQGVIRG